MSTLETVRQRLIDTGVANTSTWPCYIGYIPDDQDQVIGLIPTGGFAQDTHGGENGLPTFQASVRAGRHEYAASMAKWRQMFNALQDADLSASSIWLLQAYSTDPIFVGDGKNRVGFAVNFWAMRARE